MPKELCIDIRTASTNSKLFSSIANSPEDKISNSSKLSIRIFLLLSLSCSIASFRLAKIEYV